MLVFFIFVTFLAMSRAVIKVLSDVVFLLFGRQMLAAFGLLSKVIVPFFEDLKVLIEEVILLGQFAISSFEERVFGFLVIEAILDFSHEMFDVLALMEAVGAIFLGAFIFVMVKVVFFFNYLIGCGRFNFVLVFAFGMCGVGRSVGEGARLRVDFDNFSWLEVVIGGVVILSVLIVELMVLFGYFAGVMLVMEVMVQGRRGDLNGEKG
jgi:hypothetical protein